MKKILIAFSLSFAGSALALNVLPLPEPNSCSARCISTDEYGEEYEGLDLDIGIPGVAYIPVCSKEKALNVSLKNCIKNSELPESCLKDQESCTSYTF